MPARTAPAKTESIPVSLSRIFDQAQSSTANHQKNFVALHKVHLDAAAQVEAVDGGKSVKLVGERAFEDAFIDMINRILPVKKGMTVADRIVKFVGGYVKFMNVKVAEEQKDEEDDTTASRFVARLLKYLLRGFAAKDKNVRFRAIQTVAEMVSHLGEIDEEVYTLLRTSLLGRVNDKEAPIRVQAVIGMSKLCGSEDPADVEDGEPTVTEVLLEVLAHDTSADVRRAALLNIPPSASTLPALLARTRDVDPALRKLVFSALLEPQATGTPGFGHPRALTIAQRELVVRNGLGDREAAVRVAAGRLLGCWVDAAGDPSATADGAAKDVNVEGNVMAFLKMFDLGEGTVAEDALLSVFEGRPEIVDNLKFDDDFWTENMTPERAFLARVFVQHCRAAKDDSRLEGALPVVTALAFRIQSAYNELLQRVQTDAETGLVGDGDVDVDGDEDRVRREDERMDREFVIGEMLRLAVDLDYGDEIGRRKMFQLVRDMISQDALPESLVTKCLEVLRTLTPNERELIRVVVEVVHDLRDPEDDGDDAPPAEDDETTFGTPKTARSVRIARPVEDMTPEQRARADAMDLRCLSLCIGMLERVNGTFEENSTLEGILGELIIPAVKRKELAFREKGLVALGLCCLIARRMALNSFQLFLSQLQTSPEVLKIRVLQIVFDMLMVHEGDFLGRGEGAAGAANGERIIEFLLQVLDQEDSEKVQALICVGMAKLALSGMVADSRVLRSLIVAYVSPDSADNQELRQCLAYFFPVYCYSLPANQRRMQEIFVPAYEHLVKAAKDLDGDADMIPLAQVAGMFVDWTDPLKAVEVRGQAADETIHLDLASDIVKTLFNDELSKDDKKALCQLLGKLHLPDTVDDDKVQTLKLLMHNLVSRRPLRDTAAKNAYAKFDAAIEKKFEKQLADFNEDQYRQMEHLHELFEFLDEIMPEDEEDEVEVPKKRATKKRRSDSIATDTTSTSAAESRESGTPAPSKSKRKAGPKKGAKRRRLTNSDDDSDEDEDGSTQHGASPPPKDAPRRSLPKRTAAGKKKAVVQGSDEESDEDEDGTPAPSRKRAAPKSNPAKKTRGKTAEELQLDAEIDDLLDSDTPQDTPLASEEEGEEADEVDDML